MSARRRTTTLVAAIAVLVAPTAGADPADPALPVDAGTVAPPCPFADGVPHLPSPENLPPGTTATAPQGGTPTLSYLRDVWHAVRSQDITPGDALLLIAQRPMNAAPPPS